MLGSSLLSILEKIQKKEVSSAEVNSYFESRQSKYDSSLDSFMPLDDTSQNNISSQITTSEKPFKGVRLAIKDNFCTKGIKTTASSKVLDTFIPEYNATVISKLEQNGAFVQGKTNMDAWAHGSSTETSQYFTTKNPYSDEHVPGGSSGGSSAAMAAYLTPAAIGSETAGSIRLPASWSGVVGLKPTYGRVSRYGVVAMGSSWDCPGPLTSTVEDAAFILEHIAGKDEYDGTTTPLEVGKYVKSLKNPRKLTIGVSEEYTKNLDADVAKSYENTLKLLANMGHTIKNVKIIDPMYSISVYMILQRSEVSSNLGRYDGIRYANDRSHFGDEAKKRIMLGTYALSSGYYDAYYKKAQKVRKVISNDFKRVFEDVDVIFAPTTPITATKIGASKEYAFYGEMMDILTEPAATAGIPAISIPSTLSNTGLPIGMQFMGKHFDEETILNIAHQTEQALNFDRVTILKQKYPEII